MEKLPGQGEEQRSVPITYRAAIVAQREGEEIPLGLNARGSSIRELAEDLLAKASELESEAKEKLDQAETAAETDRGKQQRAERSGRRHRSWE
jgi:Skp family chaperone for outer membrane proteins